MEAVNFFAPKPPKGLKRRAPKKLPEKQQQKRDAEKEKQQDAKDTLKLIKGELGLEEPKDSNWLPLYKHDFDTDENVYMGQLLISMEVMPKAISQSRPAGFGRSEPNMNPYLPKPVGRFKFSWNPLYMCQELMGPALCFRTCCCCWCVIITAIVAIMAPFGEIVFVALKPFMQYTWFWCLVVGGIIVCLCCCVACELHAKWRMHMDELEEQFREQEEARLRQEAQDRLALEEAAAAAAESDDDDQVLGSSESSEEQLTDPDMGSDEDPAIKNPLLDLESGGASKVGEVEMTAIGEPVATRLLL
jgi:hypothetical protein